MIFSWLAAHLAVGGLLSLLLVAPQEFGRGFHRFTGALGSLLIAAGLAGGALRGGWGWGFLVSCVAWVLLTHLGRIAWIRPGLLPLTAVGLVALMRGTPYLPRSPVLQAEFWATPANALAAGLLLGSATLAMLVGHWYLVIPGLDIRHLRRLTRFLALCLALRVVVALGGIATSTPAPFTGEASVWRVAGVRDAFFFWQRVIIGLLAPAVLTLLTERTVRIRSTQSATGLLYVMVIFVLMGEMISRFLYVAVGIPQ